MTGSSEGGGSLWDDAEHPQAGAGARPAEHGRQAGAGARPADHAAPAPWPGPAPNRFAPPRHPRSGRGAAIAGPGPELILAGWWRRALAATLDTLIIALVAVAVLVALGIGFFSADSEAETIAAGALSLLALAVVVAVTLVYAPVMLWLTNGKTLGRMAAGTRVVRANGAPMTLAVATIREVVLKAVVFGLLSQATFGLAGLIDVLWPLVDRENRALHDFGVDTRTVLD